MYFSFCQLSYPDSYGSNANAGDFFIFIWVKPLYPYALSKTHDRKKPAITRLRVFSFFRQRPVALPFNTIYRR